MSVPLITHEDGCLVRHGRENLDVGDLDQNRNLKIRTFVRLGLRPVFEDLQAHLKFREMGVDGIAPGQYYQDFEALPRQFGYDRAFDTALRVSLQKATTEGRQGPVERLVVETRATLSARVAEGPAPAVGFDPPFGAPAVAGRSRVIHILTRPNNPPGQREVTEIPSQLDFMSIQPFQGAFPTIDALSEVPGGFTATGSADAEPPLGIWGIANSDVFQHVHAREYLFAMENRVTALLADAGLPIADFAPTRARVIFRRPSLVGERYQLRCRLYQQGEALLALGSFHRAGDDGIDERPGSYLRFEGALGG